MRVDPVDDGLVIDLKEAGDSTETDSVHIHLQGFSPQFERVSLLLGGRVVGLGAGVTAIFLAAAHGLAVLCLTMEGAAQRTAGRDRGSIHT